MPIEKSLVSKYISVVHRLSQSFYEQELSQYQIGCGQQFFLLRIYQEPGISLQELARKGCYDKGTVTRAVQKLEELEYIRRVTDDKDRRLVRLYIMDKAPPVIEHIYDMLDQWHTVLANQLTQEQIDETERLLKKIADNAFNHMEHRKEEKNAANSSNTKEKSIRT